MRNAFLYSLRLCSAVVALLACGLTARAQDTAVYATLHSFDYIDGSTPENLVEGNDGNFYGTTFFGGFEYMAGKNNFGNGTIFQVSPQGEISTIYVFSGDNDGQHPSTLIKGIDGNFYGIARCGVNSYGAAVFRITPTGNLTTIYTAGDFNEINSLTQDDDGNFYGITYGNSGNGSIFRLTQAGVYSTIYTFTGGDDGYALYGLTRGSDGNFYSAGGGGADSSGTICQVTPQGAFKTLYTFTGGADGFLPNGLTLGPDGNLYGTTQAGGADFYGVVFRITNAGGFTVLHDFTGGSDSGVPVQNLVAGLDGNLYGIAAGDTQPMATPLNTGGSAIPIVNPPVVPVGAPAPALPSVFYRITLQGALTPLYARGTTIGGTINGGNGFIQGSDGGFYGTDSGQDETAGSVFKLAIKSHPTFFTGQVPLVNEVGYLAFPNGNIFGYYSFLDNPSYLYHFDLGYEYLFDAKDGHGGLYLYDFASSDFFYTSPIFPFPYLYDFGLQSVVYYYSDPNNAGHYNTDGVRYFYNFATGQIITK